MPTSTVSWPINKKPNEIRETTVKERYQSKFEKGYVQSRPKFTRPRKKFSLIWDQTPHNVLTDNEKEDLDLFFQNHSHETILFEHPFNSGRTYDVLFEDDELEFELIHYSEGRFGEVRRYWSATINLIEQ